MPVNKYPLIICEICGLPDGVRKIPDLELNCECKGRLCRAHCITGHGTHAGTEQPEPYRAEFIKWKIRNKSQDGRNRSMAEPVLGAFQQIHGSTKH